MKIFVTAKPCAGRNSLEEINLSGDRKETERRFEIFVKEPPVQGRANRAILGLVAEHFKIPVTRIRIISGFTARQKVLEIQ